MDNIVSETKNERSARGIHAQFSQLTGIDNSSEIRFETKEEIRSELSLYSIEKKQIEKVVKNSWDQSNYGGIPLDYDKDNKTIYIDNSDAHTLLIGATGSKKSRLVAMPTVLTLAAAGESMIICDPKAEIYNRTAISLENMGYKISVLNFRDPLHGDAWNILAIPYNYYCNNEIDKSCEFINDLAINLIPIQDKDPYWDYSSRDLLFGLILLLFQLCKNNNRSVEEVNISSVLRLKSDLFDTMESSKIMQSKLWKYIETNELIYNRLLGIVICPENTLSCILSAFEQHMSCFSFQPQLVNMLSSNTLCLDMVGFERNALFIIMPDEKTTYHRIISIFVKETYEYLIDLAHKQCNGNRFPVRINYILDEFSSLPAISDFPQMVSASRSRNIRFLLIVQSKHQLKERYGEETETIQSNCGNWMFLFSREMSLLNEISSLCGEKKSVPLVSVFFLQHLNKENGECLILAGRHRPYIAHLADIDTLDGGFFKQRPLIERQGMQPSRLPALDDLLQYNSNIDLNQIDFDLNLEFDIERKFDELFENEEGENVDALNNL